VENQPIYLYIGTSESLAEILASTSVLRVESDSEAVATLEHHPEIPQVIISSPDYVERSARLRQADRIVQGQQTLDLLRYAGRELAALEPEQLAEMNVATRIELLRNNIRRCAHDLLHYDVIEIRLLNRETNQLEPLLEEGMTPEAANRILYALPEGNGVTGYVAATGKSYYCADTARDPLYLEGAIGAKCSITVPLKIHEQVIGTLNVESPKVGGFLAEDLYFTELFGNEIAQALHTLNLLSAQLMTTATQSIEAINREIALPADELLSVASTLLARAQTHDPAAVESLQKIINAARTIKGVIQKVGEEIAPESEGKVCRTTAALRGMRVLVVDDDERTRRSAHSILEKHGCQVETASSGEQGLTMAKNLPYDAIVSDIRLPDVSGFEAFRRFREAQPKANVILMTGFGYDSGHCLVKARQSGLKYIVYKPFRLDQLFEALLCVDSKPS
jgi:CheY-like chemotaxis protein